MASHSFLEFSFRLTNVEFITSFAFDCMNIIETVAGKRLGEDRWSYFQSVH